MLLRVSHRSTSMQFKKRQLAIPLITVKLLNKKLVTSNPRGRMYEKEEFEGTDRFREWAQHRYGIWRIYGETLKTFLEILKIETGLAPTDCRQ